jgi:hypothetical protein
MVPPAGHSKAPRTEWSGALPRYLASGTPAFQHGRRGFDPDTDVWGVASATFPVWLVDGRSPCDTGHEIRVGVLTLSPAGGPAGGSFHTGAAG